MWFNNIDGTTIRFNDINVMIILFWWHVWYHVTRYDLTMPRGGLLILYTLYMWWWYDMRKWFYGDGYVVLGAPMDESR